jgi:hypothetical protein
MRTEEKKNKTSDVPQERIRPFVPLAESLSPEFRTFCERLIFLIRENGISRLTPNLENREEILEFSKYVHEGWKEAQALIIERVLKNLSAISALKADLKNARRARNKDLEKKIDNELHARALENRVMRNMIDSIAWSMLQGETSTIRRLSLKGGHSNFREPNIRDALASLEHFNKSDFEVVICCDLTSFIHVGDLLSFNYLTGQIRFIELKSGSTNAALSKLAQFAVASSCEIFEAQAKDTFTPSEGKQFDRIKRQITKGNQVLDILNNEQGTDPNSGANVRLYPTPYAIMSYASDIVECYEQLSDKKSWAITTVDGCLHVGVYNNPTQAFVAFNGWMDGIKCTSPVYNITDCIRTLHATPFASLGLPTNLLKQIIKGQIMIVMCLDVRAFVEVANTMFPNLLSYADKKASAEADRLHGMPLKLGNQAIATASGGYVGLGLIDRILFGLRRPQQVIRALHLMLDTDSAA